MARILLVDDDKDILKLGQKLLSRAQHEVVTASNGIEALKILEKFSFDMAILDANMPQMSGFEVLIQIRQNPQWKNMSVALLTARNTKNDVQRALQLGVDEYIVKPIDPIIFLEKVGSLLEKKQPHQWPQVDMLEEDKTSKANVLVEMKILSVSELGLTLEATFCPKDGDTFQVESSLFQELGLEAPIVKVISVQAIPKKIKKAMELQNNKTSFRALNNTNEKGAPTLGPKEKLREMNERDNQFLKDFKLGLNDDLSNNKSISHESTPYFKNQESWIIKTYFIGAKDQFLQQIRSWMYKNILRRAA